MTSRIERFDQFEFSAPLMRRLKESGHDIPSHLQVACIPSLLAGRDLLAHADTGTGRTMAFVLPLLETLHIDCGQPQVLVLTPSDETSLHVSEVFQDCGRYIPGFHVLPIYHQSSSIQLRQLKRGTHVVVGTPRRVAHHVDNGSLSLDGIGRLVLDEADAMLREGFIDDIERLLDHARPQSQIAIFSGTLPVRLRQFVQRRLRKPMKVRGTEKSAVAPPTRLRYWQVDSSAKLNALTRIFEVEPGFDAAIVFVRGKAAATKLTEKLRARGYAAEALGADSPRKQRAQVVDQFRNGTLDIVVGTDLAVEELDVTRLTHVVSYDMPCDAASHVRRIAHLARTKRGGTAILLVAPREMAMLHSIEHATQQVIAPQVLPERYR